MKDLLSYATDDDLFVTPSAATTPPDGHIGLEGFLRLLVRAMRDPSARAEVVRRVRREVPIWAKPFVALIVGKALDAVAKWASGEAAGTSPVEGRR